jgi:hypothetical protein
MNWPDNDGTIPSESRALYTLVDPSSPPPKPKFRFAL